MCGAGHPKLVLCDDLEDWVGRDLGGVSGWRGHTCTYGRLILTYGRNRHGVIK